MGGLYLNGEWTSHALAEMAVAIAGKGIKKYVGFTALNYNDELERELQYAASSVPLGSSIGAYKPAADVEFLKNEADRFIDDVGDEYGLVLVDFVITYRPRTSSKIRTDKILKCNITKVDDSSSQGPSGNKTKFTLLPNDVIERNGKALIRASKTIKKLAIR